MKVVSMALTEGLDFTYLLGDNDELQYGLEAIGYRTEINAL